MKAKKKPKVRTDIDLGTPELQKKGIKSYASGQMRYVQTMLDYYLYRDWINEKQFLAGQKFHFLFEFSGGIKLSAMKLDDERGLALLDEAQEEGFEKFRRKYMAAVRILPLSVLKVVQDVCCYQVDISGKPRLVMDLREGLDVLAEHLGI